jgi:hypothetical protein
MVPECRAPRARRQLTEMNFARDRFKTYHQRAQDLILVNANGAIRHRVNLRMSCRVQTRCFCHLVRREHHKRNATLLTVTAGQKI